jgi:hypothetical protein
METGSMALNTPLPFICELEFQPHLLQANKPKGVVHLFYFFRKKRNILVE